MVFDGQLDHLVSVEDMSKFIDIRLRQSGLMAKKPFHLRTASYEFQPEGSEHLHLWSW